MPRCSCTFRSSHPRLSSSSSELPLVSATAPARIVWLGRSGDSELPPTCLSGLFTVVIVRTNALNLDVSFAAGQSERNDPVVPAGRLTGIVVPATKPVVLLVDDVSATRNST